VRWNRIGPTLRGEFRFYADYVRGRMMKTEVIVRRDGSLVVETVNRGDVACGCVRLIEAERLPSVADMS
jgi:hypothetical protein